MIAPVSILSRSFVCFITSRPLALQPLFVLYYPQSHTSSPDVPLATPSNHWQMMYLYSLLYTQVKDDQPPDVKTKSHPSVGIFVKMSTF